MNEAYLLLIQYPSLRRLTNAQLAPHHGPRNNCKAENNSQDSNRIHIHQSSYDVLLTHSKADDVCAEVESYIERPREIK